MKDLIDRNAVIKIINDELEYSDNVYATSVCITIRRAVNVLPSAQAELAQNLHTTCTDAISRQAAIEAFWKLEAELRPSAIDAVLNMLKNLPSAQPEIIHCKNCKHRDSNDCPMYYEEWIEIDEGDGYFDTDNIIHDRTTDEGFCHCAELRGGQE